MEDYDKPLRSRAVSMQEASSASAAANAVAQHRQ